MYSIIITPHFHKDLEKYLQDKPEEKPKIVKILIELITDPDHPALRTHKLNSSDDWSISIDMSTRILFDVEGDNIILKKIGSHESVYI